MAGSKVSDDVEAVRRYASALLELAQDKGELSTIHKEFKELMASVKGSKDLARLLASPAFSRSDKVSALGAISKKSGFSPLFGRFLGAMAANGRAKDIPAAAEAFESLYARQRGVSRVVVRTAAPMTAEQQKRVEGMVRAGVGGEIEVSSEVDPSLIGGIQVRIGSKLIDASLATKLNRMNLAMKGA